MDATTLPRQHPSLWYRGFIALAIVAICGALLATLPPQGGELRANPQLIQIASDQPGAILSVIVQKATRDRSVEQRLTSLGGTITADLPIVNGFAAKLSARAVPILARDSGVRWVSLDAPVLRQSCSGTGCIDPSKVASAYVKAIGADQVWNRTTPIRGQGVGVAVLDSGVNDNQDLFSDVTWTSRVQGNVAYNSGWNQSATDMFGHGNQVAGIIGGNGSRSNGTYVGVAPRVNIINVKISDDLNQGTATTSSVVTGMQWIYDNRVKYNIRVVNISLTDSVVESYNVSVLDAAAEQLWFNGIVVVAAAGNSGESGAGSLAAPANDPFVITVGASDDRGTASTSDDTLPSWSSYGPTVDGFAKPDLVAPGVNLLAPLLVPNSYLAMKYPDHVQHTLLYGDYMRMSGTSLAAPVVSGAVALMLQANPALTPDQVKYRLTWTALPLWSGDARAGAGLLNVPRAIDTGTTGRANVNQKISDLNIDSTTGTVWTSPTSTAKWSTAKWSTAKWSTAKWSTAKWSTFRP